MFILSINNEIDGCELDPNHPFAWYKRAFFANVSSIFLFDMNFFALAVFTLNAVISFSRALPNIDMVILCKNNKNRRYFISSPRCSQKIVRIVTVSSGTREVSHRK